MGLPVFQTLDLKPQVAFSVLRPSPGGPSPRAVQPSGYNTHGFGDTSLPMSRSDFRPKSFLAPFIAIHSFIHSLPCRLWIQTVWGQAWCCPSLTE